MCFLPASWEELLEHTKHSWQYPLVEAPTQLNTVSNVQTDQMLKGIRLAQQNPHCLHKFEINVMHDGL